MFLLTAIPCSFASNDPILPAELYKERHWPECGLECKRLIAAGMASESIHLIDTLSESNSQDLQVTVNQLQRICASPDANLQTKALANYKLAQLEWTSGNTIEAATRFKQTFQTAESRDLFIRAACSLHILFTNNPELKFLFPELVPQLQTCANLWNSRILTECDLSRGAKKKNAITGRPFQWIVSFYRSQISPAIGQRCSLSPSCSEYASQAFKRHGLLGLAIFADRSVREPDVVARKEYPVLQNNQWKYADPLETHTSWLAAIETKSTHHEKASMLSSVLSESNAQRTSHLSCLNTETTRKLATMLDMERKHKESALEFRRLAMMQDDDASPDKAGFYWASAYQYWLASEFETAMKMLDSAEMYSNKLAEESAFMRGFISHEKKQHDEAEFYFQSLLADDASPHPDIVTFASGRLAEISASRKEYNKAVQYLTDAPVQNQHAIKSIQDYAAGSDKNPTLGGYMGMVPGLGYAYSGEYANALRSIILNGLFIYGMIETADNKQWGAFSVITFFEITWYTGSIYGGIDSAHRYNEKRLSACINAIRGNSSFSTDLNALPAISLKFKF